MGMSSSSRSSDGTTCVRARAGAGFKRCCMTGGRYDGSPRGYYFREPED